MNTSAATSPSTTSSPSSPSTASFKKSPRFDSIMHKRQIPLAAAYKENPEQAWVVDAAITGVSKTDINDPLHTAVETAGFTIPIGVHPAVGGDGDKPNPGELLSASLAACMDSTIRIIANRLSIVLTHLEVVVSAEIDVRGTLRLSQKVPVGFKNIHLSINIDTASGTKPSMVKALLQAAEASCVVMQTLRHPPEITTQNNIGSD